MAVDLELIPYTGKRWPKKATLIRRKKEYHVRNWSVFFGIISAVPTEELPLNMAVVRSGYPDEDIVSTDSPLSGERLGYIPASKVVSAMNRAIRQWKRPGPDWTEMDIREDKESFKKVKGILGAMKRLKPRTPVILYWW